MGHIKFACLVSVAGILGFSAMAEDTASARAEFAREQAVAEMRRAVAQCDILAGNQEALSARMAKIEAASPESEIANLKAEVSGLKAEIDGLKKSQEALRQQIVDDLSKKIAAMPAPSAPVSAKSAKGKHSKNKGTSGSKSEDTDSEASGSYYEHIVTAGQTLTEIAGGYGVSVKSIKSMNHLRSDVLRIGQKLRIPAESDK